MSRGKILALMKSIERLGPSLGGSLSEVRRVCSKPTCRCAVDPEARHPAWMLTWTESGKPKSAHVSAANAGKVKQWIHARHQLKELLKEMDALLREEIRGEKAQAARNATATASASGRGRGRPPKAKNAAD